MRFVFELLSGSPIAREMILVVPEFVALPEPWATKKALVPNSAMRKLCILFLGLCLKESRVRARREGCVGVRRRGLLFEESSGRARA